MDDASRFAIVQEESQQFHAGLGGESDSSDDVKHMVDPALDGSDDLRPARASATFSPLSTRCGELPSDCSIDQFHTPPAKIHKRNAELNYWKDFADQVEKSLAKPQESEFRIVAHQSSGIKTCDALEAVERGKNLQVGRSFRARRGDEDFF